MVWAGRRSDGVNSRAGASRWWHVDRGGLIKRRDVIVGKKVVGSRGVRPSGINGCGKEMVVCNRRSDGRFDRSYGGGGSGLDSGQENVMGISKV